VIDIERFHLGGFSMDQSNSPNPSGQTPPPLPSQPLDNRSASTQTASASSTYERVADKVGMVPSMRLSDNLISLAGAVVGAIIGVIAGGIFRGGIGMAVGGVGGLFIGVVLAGLYLGIRNLFRK
jgi:hypothetical protein